MDIDFKNIAGLAPALVHEDGTGEVLMVHFMNLDAFTKTLDAGYVISYSRTPQQLWAKSETSSNRSQVISALTGCDRDIVLLRASGEGDGVFCHTGTKSWFTKELSSRQRGRNQESLFGNFQKQPSGSNSGPGETGWPTRQLSRKGLEEIASALTTLAEVEGRTAHPELLRVRCAHA